MNTAYVFMRKKPTKINRRLPNWSKIDNAVPPESVFRPQLFIIFITDQTTFLTNFKLYVDDGKPVIMILTG